MTGYTEKGLKNIKNFHCQNNVTLLWIISYYGVLKWWKIR